MKTAVTLSLVEAARNGPFVFHDDLAQAAHHAQEIGFDAVELFLPGPSDELARQIDAEIVARGLKVAAFGTGAGWVMQQLTLTSAAEDVRLRAEQFVMQMLEFAARWQAPVIIGSMQGRWGDAVSRGQALEWLGDSLARIAQRAQQLGNSVLFEPINRYETNLCRRLEEGYRVLAPIQNLPIKLLADLFHMNIEEADLGQALRNARSLIGHVHFVDSNRCAAGMGHLDLVLVAAALRQIGYNGYLSVEGFPIPDSVECARQSLRAAKVLFGLDESA